MRKAWNDIKEMAYYPFHGYFAILCVFINFYKARLSEFMADKTSSSGVVFMYIKSAWYQW